MKFTIEKSTLLNSLENVIRCIDANNIYLHLRYFYIEVLDEIIIIKGTNGYFSIEDKILESNVEIISLGKFLIPANMFINVIKKCNNKVVIELKSENVLLIQNEKDKYEINLLPIDEYPNIDFSLYGNKIKINAEKLKKAIDNVVFASSVSNEEIILTGVNFKYEKGKLILTATDSFRLAQEIIEVKDDRNITFDVTVANKNIKNFIPQDLKEDIDFYANEHKINIIHKTTNYQSKIIDAPYKTVSQLFDIRFDKKLIIDKSILSNAISKATAISGESSQNKLFLSITQEGIKLSTQTNEIGSSHVFIEPNEYEFIGDDISIILNYKFLKEAISVFNDKININLIESRGLIMIESEKSTSKQLISPLAN